jgi:hypothetical protein
VTRADETNIFCSHNSHLLQHSWIMNNAMNTAKCEDRDNILKQNRSICQKAFSVYLPRTSFRPPSQSIPMAGISIATRLPLASYFAIFKGGWMWLQKGSVIASRRGILLRVLLWTATCWVKPHLFISTLHRFTHSIRISAPAVHNLAAQSGHIHTYIHSVSSSCWTGTFNGRRKLDCGHYMQQSPFLEANSCLAG